jgi:hypothetical protein
MNPEALRAFAPLHLLIDCFWLSADDEVGGMLPNS